MHSWDPHYQALTETHDSGQDAQKGGLLYARYGKGAYVYVAYALYRQLPEGIPGAYRLFANLLSLPKAPATLPTITPPKNNPPKLYPANKSQGALRLAFEKWDTRTHTSNMAKLYPSNAIPQTNRRVPHIPDFL